MPAKKGHAFQNVPRTFQLEIKRDHLLTRMRQGADCRVYALLAPSGYGKTTLLAQYARSSRRPCVWLSLQSTDVSALGLAKHLTQALSLNVLADNPPLISEDLPTDALALILAEALNESGVNTLLFFDGIEFLTPTSARWLSRFIERLEEGHQVLLAGYQAGALPLGQWVARGEALLFGSAELAFSVEETQSYLSLSSSTSNAHKLHDSLEGWVAGITLVASGSPLGYAAGDLLAERLEALPEEWQPLLPLLAVCPIWTDPLPVWVGVDLPRGWLNVMTAAGFPLTPLGQGNFRPHTSLVELLEARLALESHQRIQQYLRAARQAEHEGQLGQAFQYYQQIEDQDNALRVIAQEIPELIRRAEFGQILSSLEGFDEDRLGPELGLALGIACLALGQAVRGEALLRRIQKSGYETAELYRHLAFAAYRRGQPSEMRQHLERAKVLPHSIREEIALLSIIPVAHREVGELQLALRVAQAAVHLAKEQGLEMLLAKATVILADAYGDLEQFEESERHYKSALQLYDRLRIDGRKLEIFHNLAIVYLNQNRLSEALNLIERGLLPISDPDKRWPAYLLGLRATLWAQQGLFERALEDVHIAVIACQERGIANHELIFEQYRLDYLCYLRRAKEAVAQLKKVTTLSPETTPATDAQQAFSCALLAYIQDDLEKAKLYFEQADTELLGVYERTQVWVFKAAINEQQCQPYADELAEAFQRLDQLGHDAPLQMLAVLLNDFYQRVEGTAGARLRGVLVGEIVAETVLSFTVQMLGEFGLRMQEAPMEIGIAKAQELLCFLALHGPSTRDVLVTALWNGSRRREHGDYFKVIVRRLRAALSAHPAVSFDPLPFQNGKYQLSPAFTVQSEVATLLSFHHPVPKSLKELADVMKPFLPAFEADWVMETRQSCYGAAISLALSLGAVLEAKSIIESLEVYRMVLDVEPFEPHAYQALRRLIESQQDPQLQVRFAAYL